MSEASQIGSTGSLWNTVMFSPIESPKLSFVFKMMVRHAAASRKSRFGTAILDERNWDQTERLHAVPGCRSEARERNQKEKWKNGSPELRSSGELVIAGENSLRIIYSP